MPVLAGERLIGGRKFQLCLLDFFGRRVLCLVPAALVHLGEHIVLNLMLLGQQVHEFVHQRRGGTFVGILVVVVGHEFFGRQRMCQHLFLGHGVFIHLDILRF